MDAESLQALLWLLKTRNGQPCRMADLDFDILAFVNAYSDAANVEAAKVKKAEKETNVPKGSSNARKTRASTET